MKIYDKLENDDDDKNNNIQLNNKYKFNGLAEVTEMTDESKSSFSDTSDSNICDISLGSDSSSNTDDNSTESDTFSRVKMADDIKQIELMASELFDKSKEPQI